MGLNILSYHFDGPFDVDAIEIREKRCGVYLIVDQAPEGPYILDVGEVSEIEDRLVYHLRRNCWERYRRHQLVVYLAFTTGQSREESKEVVDSIKLTFDPPCRE